MTLILALKPALNPLNIVLIVRSGPRGLCTVSLKSPLLGSVLSCKRESGREKMVKAS